MAPVLTVHLQALCWSHPPLPRYGEHPGGPCGYTCLGPISVLTPGTHSSCVECLKFGKGPLEKNCSEACGNLKLVDKPVKGKPCKEQDSEGCWMNFTMRQLYGKNYEVHVLDDRGAASGTGPQKLVTPDSGGCRERGCRLGAKACSCVSPVSPTAKRMRKFCSDYGHCWPPAHTTPAMPGPVQL